MIQRQMNEFILERGFEKKKLKMVVAHRQGCQLSCLALFNYYVEYISRQ